MKKKIFITGASSFLGSSLVEKLRDSYEVIVLQHRATAPITGVEIIKGGLENISDWHTQLPNIDIVIHLAAITHTNDMSAYEKINALSTRDLADLAKQKNASQFIFISTRAIGSACGAYGLSKEHAEHSIQNSGVAYTIVRVGEAYDTDWSKAEGLGSIATLIDKSPIIPYIASKKPLFAPIHKDDVLDGILATIENPSAYSKTYTLAGPENLTFKEVVERMCKKEKVRRLLLPIPIPLARVGFFILSKIFKRAPQDQLQRLLGAKQGLSKNVDTDLHIHPRLFLAQNK